MDQLIEEGLATTQPLTMTRRYATSYKIQGRELRSKFAMINWRSPHYSERGPGEGARPGGGLRRVPRAGIGAAAPALQNPRATLTHLLQYHPETHRLCAAGADRHHRPGVWDGVLWAGQAGPRWHRPGHGAKHHGPHVLKRHLPGSAPLLPPPPCPSRRPPALRAALARSLACSCEGRRPDPPPAPHPHIQPTRTRARTHCLQACSTA